MLLDIAALKGVDMLPDDYMITVADLEAAMNGRMSRSAKGDAVLIRTGWGRLWTVDNARFIKGEPGIGLEAAEFLVKRNVMIVGSDNWAVEVRPYPDKDLFLPVHGYLLNVNGIYLVENLDLEALARDKANEFAFIGRRRSSCAAHRIERRADRGEIRDLPLIATAPCRKSPGSARPCGARNTA